MTTYYYLTDLGEDYMNSLGTYSEELGTKIIGINERWPLEILRTIKDIPNCTFNKIVKYWEKILRGKATDEFIRGLKDYLRDFYEAGYIETKVK